LYFWKNNTGELIKGTGFKTFSPTLIAMKDENLRKFGMYLNQKSGNAGEDDS